MVNDCCIAIFLEILTVKKNKNRPIFDEDMCKAFGVHFLGPSCIHGRSDGVDIGIYTPQLSPSKLFMG